MSVVREGRSDSAFPRPFMAKPRKPGRVIVIPPSKAMAHRVLREAGSEPVAWCYLGETVPRAIAWGRWFEGRAERIEGGGLLQEVARRSRQPFIEYIGELSAEHASDAWWLTSLAEKNPYVSRVFLQSCYVEAAAELVQERESKGVLLLVVENRAVRECLREHLVGTLGKGLHCRERIGERLLARIGEWLEFWVRWIHFVAKHLVRLAIARVLVAHAVRGTQEEGSGIILIHSWVDGRSFDGQGRYRSINFGDLDRYLAAQARPWAIVPAILPALPFLAGVRALVRSGVPFLLPQRFLRPEDVVDQAMLSLSRPQAAAWPPFQGVDISALIEADRQRDWVLGRMRVNALLSAAVARWREAGIRIESFIYPFENHLWEKAYCLAFRRDYPEARLVGYQDANLPTMALNFFVATRERTLAPLPDVLITNGRCSYDLLADGGHDPARLRCGGALRYRYLLDLPTELRGTSAPAHAVVLVTTSIGMSLACELLWKALQAFEPQSQVRVVIKCHPGLPFNALSVALGLERLPGHFEVSDQPVSNLLRRSGALVYMDSTTSLEALALSVPVIHVASDYELDFDPLSATPEVRLTVRTPEEIRGAFLSLSRHPESAAHRSRRGREVIPTFFGPLDEGAYRWFVETGTEAGREASATV